MTPEDRFNEQYKEGSTPWDIGKPDFNLVQTVTTTPIAPCKALEIGCGTGDNAIWLSQQNFNVIGIDISEIAIEKAGEKVAKANVTCAFAVLNILKTHVDGAPLGFVFDRGCFHTMDSAERRPRLRARGNNGADLSRPRHSISPKPAASVLRGVNRRRRSPGMVRRVRRRGRTRSQVTRLPPTQSRTQ